MRLAEVHEHLEELIAADHIPDNTKELVPVKSGVKKWAAENAYLLIYIAAVGAVGWALTIWVLIRVAS